MRLADWAGWHDARRTCFRQGAGLHALAPVLPTFLVYVLSFVNIGIYSNNHHHMFQAVKVEALKTGTDLPEHLNALQKAWRATRRAFVRQGRSRERCHRCG